MIVYCRSLRIVTSYYFWVHLNAGLFKLLVLYVQKNRIVKKVPIFMISDQCPLWLPTYFLKLTSEVIWLGHKSMVCILWLYFAVLPMRSIFNLHIWNQENSLLISNPRFSAVFHNSHSSNKQKLEKNTLMLVKTPQNLVKILLNLFNFFLALIKIIKKIIH